MNYYPFHIGDYASATRHLSWDEDLAYRRLMDAYYMQEGPLTAEKRQLYRLVVASSKAQRLAVDIVLDEFFTLADEVYRHHRCDEELERMRVKREKAQASAQARWGNADDNREEMRTHKNIHANAQANGMRAHSEGNAPTPNTTPIKEEDGGAKAPLVDDGKKQIEEFCFGAWNRLAAEHDLSKLQRLTEPRIRALHLRLLEIGGADGWDAMIEIIKQSPFLLGENNNGWRVDIDFVLKPANLTKIMEGKYRGRTRTNPIQDAISNLGRGVQERDFSS